jgi:hypothetical protein
VESCAQRRRKNPGPRFAHSREALPPTSRRRSPERAEPIRGDERNCKPAVGDCCILGDSLLPHLPARDLAARRIILTTGAPEQSMRRVLRKSIPFVQAVLIGTLAAAAIAGVAMLLPHS